MINKRFMLRSRRSRMGVAGLAAIAAVASFTPLAHASDVEAAHYNVTLTPIFGSSVSGTGSVVQYLDDTTGAGASFTGIPKSTGTDDYSLFLSVKMDPLSSTSVTTTSVVVCRFGSMGPQYQSGCSGRSLQMPTASVVDAAHVSMFLVQNAPSTFLSVGTITSGGPVTTPPTVPPTTPTSTPVTLPTTPITATTAYRLLSADGTVASYGEPSYGDAYGSLDGTAVSIATTPSGNGYWIASSTGQVLPFGDAKAFGSMAGKPLNQPVINLTATPSGNGYWLLAKDGGVFAYGDAGFYGSTGSITLNKPAVGITPTASGKGYWFVASDGGVFAYGDAGFYGSMGSSPLNQPVNGMTVAADGKGYRMVASDGGIFSYGSAAFFGSMGANPPAAPVMAMQPTHDSTGYYMVTSNGTVYPFGSARFYGGGLSNTVAMSF